MGIQSIQAVWFDFDYHFFGNILAAGVCSTDDSYYD